MPQHVEPRPQLAAEISLSGQQAPIWGNSLTIRNGCSLLLLVFRCMLMVACPVTFIANAPTGVRGAGLLIVHPCGSLPLMVHHWCFNAGARSRRCIPAASKGGSGLLDNPTTIAPTRENG